VSGPRRRVAALPVAPVVSGYVHVPVTRPAANRPPAFNGTGAQECSPKVLVENRVSNGQTVTKQLQADTSIGL